MEEIEQSSQCIEQNPNTKNAKERPKISPPKRAAIKKRSVKLQKRSLSKKEYIKNGLKDLYTGDMKYEDALMLNDMWNGYIAEHLSIATNECSEIPEFSDPTYEHFSTLLRKMDFHGAMVKVERSKCESFLGLSGIIVLERKNILKIISKDNKIRTIPKGDCVFEIQTNNDNLSFIMFGKSARIRPAERSVKKMKSFIDCDM